MKRIASVARSEEAILDRIRALVIERASQGRPLQYEELPALHDGTLTPSTTDLACIAEEAGVTMEFLLGIHGPARLARTVRMRVGRLYWGWWRGIGRHRCGPGCGS
ncbi:hypothetical protein [Streptomyces sp. NPDC001787]|uniref:hypothetical protein n=1 Tax=Streptomyces sp. NPDC001787 TaxID=3154523 RepID=UPI003332527E